MAQLILRFWNRSYWASEDPDGSACAVCGDCCYLSMFRYTARLVPMSGHGEAMERATEVIACRSCQDALEPETTKDV